MEGEGNRSVVSAELSTRGVVITFADGQSALFPSELLYSVLPAAEVIPDAWDEEES